MKAEKLIVLPLNIEAIEKEINEKLPKEENVSYHVNEKSALVKGLDIVVDNECCYFIADKNEYTFDVYKHTKTETGRSIGMIPAYGFECTVDELKEKFLLPETDLKTFMGRRYGYNPRIITNTNNFLKDIVKRLKKVPA